MKWGAQSFSHTPFRIVEVNGMVPHRKRHKTNTAHSRGGSGLFVGEKMKDEPRFTGFCGLGRMGTWGNEEV